MKTTPENLFQILTRVGVLSADQVKELAQRWSTHQRAKPPRRRAEGRPATPEGERHEPDLLDFIVGQRLRAAKDARRLIGERELYEGLAQGLGLPFSRKRKPSGSSWKVSSILSCSGFPFRESASDSSKVTTEQSPVKLALAFVPPTATIVQGKIVDEAHIRKRWCAVLAKQTTAHSC